MGSPIYAIGQLRSLASSGADLDTPEVMQLALDALSGVTDPEIRDGLYKRLMAGFGDDLFAFVSGEDVGGRAKILQTLDQIENQHSRNRV